jgi:hypothetical protein
LIGEREQILMKFMVTQDTMELFTQHINNNTPWMMAQIHYAEGRACNLPLQPRSANSDLAPNTNGDDVHNSVLRRAIRGAVGARARAAANPTTSLARGAPQAF